MVGKTRYTVLTLLFVLNNDAVTDAQNCMSLDNCIIFNTPCLKSIVITLYTDTISCKKIFKS